MSFATGLFSFMGGLSQQYREEIDADDAAKAAAATAAVEHAKWTQEEERKDIEHQFKVGKFETEQTFKEQQEIARKREYRGDILLKRQEFKQKTKQEDIKHAFNVEKFNEATPKAT